MTINPLYTHSWKLIKLMAVDKTIAKYKCVDCGIEVYKDITTDEIFQSVDPEYMISNFPNCNEHIMKSVLK